jgi:hypothetical protein
MGFVASQAILKGKISRNAKSKTLYERQKNGILIMKTR